LVVFIIIAIELVVFIIVAIDVFYEQPQANNLRRAELYGALVGRFGAQMRLSMDKPTNQRIVGSTEQPKNKKH